jgi:1-deoxy-D-xylulose-5-phosphate synthase
MRNIPNMIVAAPMDEVELRNMMYTAQLDIVKNPYSIRYPRGRGIFTDWQKPFEIIETGKSRLLRKGRDIAVLSIGLPGNFVENAASVLEYEDIHITHYDMRFAAPIDEEALHEVFRNFDRIVTVEDGMLKGGFGSAVIEFMCDNNYSARVKRLGIPDYFVEHGTQEELYKECGFDTTSIAEAIREMTGKGKNPSGKKNIRKPGVKV